MHKRCEQGRHRWLGPTFIVNVPVGQSVLSSGIGLRCAKCEVWVTYDELFAAVGTTAWDAMQAVEEEWARQERVEQVADAMERIQ